MLRQLFLVALSVALVGCASQGVPVSGGKLAPTLVDLHVPAILGQDGSVKLSVIESCERDIPKSRILFHGGPSGVPGDLVKQLAVAGGQATTLHYERTLAGNVTCSLYSRVLFEAGMRYAIYLGDMPASTPGLSIGGTCAIAVTNNTRGFVAMSLATNACEK